MTSTPTAVSNGRASTASKSPPKPLRRKRRREEEEPGERSIISNMSRRSGRVRIGLAVMTVLLIAVLVIISGGPLLWLAKSAVSTSQDILRDPFGWWPSGIQWQNLADAWTEIRIGQFLLNTFWVVAGSWFFGMLVALTGGYGLSILKPKYAKYINGGVLATLFVPGLISLIAQYETVVDLPILHINLINTYWAMWLPAAANAVHVLIVSRFFENLPRDVFEAAKIDGAGPFGIFWRLVLPMSRPIIGVVSLLVVVQSWKEFLWPLLVLPSPNVQPISVGLYHVAEDAPRSLLIAGMFISVIVPILLFLLFQKQFLKSAGQAGAIKG